MATRPLQADCMCCGTIKMEELHKRIQARGCDILPYQTVKQSSLNMKSMGHWVADQGKIKKSRKVSEHDTCEPCSVPQTSEELYHKYKKLQKQGFKLKGFWLGISSSSSKCTQMLCTFQISDAWFDGFNSQYRLNKCVPEACRGSKGSSPTVLSHSKESCRLRDQQDLLDISHWSRLPI